MNDKNQLIRTIMISTYRFFKLSSKLEMTLMASTPNDRLLKKLQLHPAYGTKEALG